MTTAKTSFFETKYNFEAIVRFEDGTTSKIHIGFSCLELNTDYMMNFMVKEIEKRCGLKVATMTATVEPVDGQERRAVTINPSKN